MQESELNKLAEAIHQNAVDKGFWNGSQNIPEKLALVHSEVSEALEDYRKGKMETYYQQGSFKPEGFPSELADIIIRVLDLAIFLGIDITEEIKMKYEFNLTRPYMHGKKC